MTTTRSQLITKKHVTSTTTTQSTQLDDKSKNHALYYKIGAVTASITLLGIVYYAYSYTYSRYYSTQKQSTRRTLSNQLKSSRHNSITSTMSNVTTPLHHHIIHNTAINEFALRCTQLSSNGIYISDSRQLFVIIDSIQQIQYNNLKHNDLCIISSFDGTLTRQSAQLLQSNELLQCSSYLPAIYTNTYKSICNEYNQLYSNTADRLKNNAQLNFKLNQLLLSYSIHKCVITEAVMYALQNNLLQLRHSTNELFDTCKQYNIPLIINNTNSYCDIVESILQHNKIHRTDNITIHGQKFNYSTKSQLTSISDHSLNSQVYQKQHNYRNIILISDDLNDARLCDDYDHVDNIIRIGICDINDTQIIKCYLQEFDIVVTNKSLAIVNELMYVLTH